MVTQRKRDYSLLIVTGLCVLTIVVAITACYGVSAGLAKEVNDLRTEVKALRERQPQPSAATGLPTGDGSPLSTFTSKLDHVEQLANQALQASQASQACCDATNEKIDRMFRQAPQQQQDQHGSGEEDGDPSDQEE